MKRCACPCKAPLIGRSDNTLYIDHRHAQRAYRARLKKRLEAAGLPTSLSLASVEASSPTTGSNGDGHTRRKQSQRRRIEPRLSYRKAVEAAIEMLAVEDIYIPEQLAERFMLAALSPRARAQVEQQRQEAA